MGCPNCPTRPRPHRRAGKVPPGSLARSAIIIDSTFTPSVRAAATRFFPPPRNRPVSPRPKKACHARSARSRPYRHHQRCAKFCPAGARLTGAPPRGAARARPTARRPLGRQARRPLPQVSGHGLRLRPPRHPSVQCHTRCGAGHSSGQLERPRSDRRSPAPPPAQQRRAALKSRRRHAHAVGPDPPHLQHKSSVSDPFTVCKRPPDAPTRRNAAPATTAKLPRTSRVRPPEPKKSSEVGVA